VELKTVKGSRRIQEEEEQEQVMPPSTYRVTFPTRDTANAQTPLVRFVVEQVVGQVVHSVCYTDPLWGVDPVDFI